MLKDKQVLNIFLVYTNKIKSLTEIILLKKFYFEILLKVIIVCVLLAYFLTSVWKLGVHPIKNVSLCLSSWKFVVKHLLNLKLRWSFYVTVNVFYD